MFTPTFSFLVLEQFADISEEELLEVSEFCSEESDSMSCFCKNKIFIGRKKKEFIWIPLVQDG